MCGIAAVYRYSDSSLDIRSVLQRMNAIQMHRGPDGKGVYVDDRAGVGLGHTRLAIVDLSHDADQPMVSSDGLLRTAFNGEIYNWRELREELMTQGYGPFRTNSDTEVLLEAYRCYGLDMFSRLHGMFAFVIHDGRDGTVLCARDRVGKKPLLYAETNNGVAIGSELPAVKTMPGCDTSLNRNGLASMLLHNVRHIPDPETAYVGIKRLRPGHAMILRNGKVDRIWRYWNPAHTPSSLIVEELREKFERAVELRMAADVPVGALLSGGVDSTAIVSLMAQRTNGPVKTYALGLDREDEDLQRARVVAQQFGCEHREVYFDATYELQIYERLLSTYGEPIALLPLVHGYQLCDAIQQDGIKVVLAGHGADELFYGYTGHVRTAVLSRLLRYFQLIARVVQLVPTRWRSAPLTLLTAEPGLRKAALYRAYEKSTWGTVVAKGAIPELINVVEQECAYWGSLLDDPEYIDESNFIALMMENAHSVATAADLPPMMASVEMRAPFLDQQVVELALSISSEEKIPSIHDSTRLKYVLKRAVQDLVPADVLYARKRGFGHGIQEKNILLEQWRPIADELFSSPSDADGLLDANAITTLWMDHKRGRERVSWSLIAKLFVIQLWLQKLPR